jgi:hypothetical protein
MTTRRVQILWFGQSPSSSVQAACADRRLSIATVTPPLTEGQWAAGRAAVFAVSPNTTVDRLSRVYKKAVRRGFQHGLKVIFLSHLPDTLIVEGFLKKNNWVNQVENWAINREADVSEEIARWDAGPAWTGSLEVVGASDVGAEDLILLRRSFSDCSSIKLVKQTEGHSAQVFCVYARLTDSRAGPLPLPFFAKLDRATKIARERSNYDECTTLFVPFNQRPNLDFERCAIGDERGIIVGNFIEESESLQQVVERGTARGAINSLFGGALRGWRSQAYFDASNIAKCSVAQSLSQYLPSRMTPWKRRTLCEHSKEAESLGAQYPPEEIERMLLALPGKNHRTALMHGDLHGNNIRVHRSEAILIDFASTFRGPLVADPAALDVGLVMREGTLSVDDWQQFANDAYELAALRVLPPPGDPTAAAAAIWSSIRLIRQIAFADQVSEFEYATAVAINLLRRASHRPNGPEDSFRRRTAYWVAERLTLELTKSCASPQGAGGLIPSSRN